MRTTTVSLLLGSAALAVMSGCTVKDVDTPALAGPSTFAHGITMVADRDTLAQNGVDFTDIRITSTSPTGQSENIALRAQIFVDNVAQDFGTLSSKSPITPSTIRYTAPPASTLSAVPVTVQIRVTSGSGGDFRGELSREIDIRLNPQGIILPSNPNLVAAFTVSPASPLAFQTATFDASTSTNTGTACNSACLYSWNFGDGTSSSGRTTTHAFRAAGNFAVQLTVTDARGASATSTQAVTVQAPTPPTVSFTVSPTPAPTNVDIFFNAAAARAASGRTLTNYQWNFGDGASGSGVTVSHRYAGPGSYQVTLTVTDDAGATAQAVQNLPVGAPESRANAQLTGTAGAGKRVVYDASASTPSTGATIVSYRFDYGDNSPAETVSNPVQSHTYGSVGIVVASVEITDSAGKTSTKTVSVTVLP